MQFLKYLSVGLLNTLVGYGVFYILARFLKVIPEVANAIGYILALAVAFVLNKIYVFRGDVVASKTMPKFLLAFALAFAINQFILIFFYRFMGFGAEISQVLAMLTYTLTFYALNKHFVFQTLQKN